MNTLDKYIEKLVEWTTLQVKSAGLKGVIVGISGGVDSAVVAAIAKKAFPDNSLAVKLPCHSPNIDIEYANKVIEAIKIQNKTIDLSKTFDVIMEELEVSNVLAKANTKARLRMSSLYALAQENGYLVLGTDNAAEWYTGYFTKHGDGGVDLVPIVHLTKGEVREAAKILNIPNEIIKRTPTASLFEGQTDEGEMGVTYNVIDAYLLGEQVSAKDKEKIEWLHKVSEHKRHLAVAPEKFIRKS